MSVFVCQTLSLSGVGFCKPISVFACQSLSGLGVGHRVPPQLLKFYGEHFGLHCGVS